MKTSPKVAIIMGSQSDWPKMEAALNVLNEFGVSSEVKVVSAHRTPHWMVQFAESAERRGVMAIIAGAGGAAHLPGMVASLTTLPVIGVPIEVGSLKGLDALLSIAQMPRGIPVATVAVDNSHNAGLLAVRMLASHDLRLKKKLKQLHKNQRDRVLKSKEIVQK